MKEAWRWFGKNDPICLNNIKETGAKQIITALHDVPCGEIWPLDKITHMQKQINDIGLTWNIVESLPVHEDIKQNKPSAQKYINNYIQSMENLAKGNIKTICYNFMPVTDWTRTCIFDPQDDGSLALSFDYIRYIAYDVFLLKRHQAKNDYSAEQLQKAEQLFNHLEDSQKQELIDVIGMGLPGTVDNLSLTEIKAKIEDYQNISHQDLRQNLILFLKQIIPHAERLGIKMAIHPDDPPISLLGLPRIVSSYDDLNTIFTQVPSPNNGLTLCIGSLGAGVHNDVIKIAQTFSDRIYFAHLRNVKHKDHYFCEAQHLEGDQNMCKIIDILLQEENKRKLAAVDGQEITFRPDHGALMLTDKNLDHSHYYPGYSLIGRLKALAELRGVIQGIQYRSNYGEYHEKLL